MEGKTYTESILIPGQSVLLTRPKIWNPWSGAIQLIEGTNESHCAIVYDSQDFGTPMVLHSKMFNVHTMSVEQFLKSSLIVAIFDFSYVPKEIWNNALKLFSSDMAKGYSYFQLPFLAMQRLFGIQSRFDDPGMTCSELVAKYLYSGILNGTPEHQLCDYGLVEVRSILESARLK